MCVVDIGTAMSGTNASDPPSGKALPGVRLRGIAKSSSGPSANVDRVCKDECLQMIDQYVQILETAISSSWDLSAQDRLQRPPTESNCAVYNEHAEVRGCCIIDATPSAFTWPAWLSSSVPVSVCPSFLLSLDAPSQVKVPCHAGCNGLFCCKQPFCVFRQVMRISSVIF